LNNTLYQTTYYFTNLFCYTTCMAYTINSTIMCVNNKYVLSNWSEDYFYYCSERNNAVELFATLKVQSFIFTEVSDCGLLVVVASSTFLERKDMLKEKSSQSKISSRLLAYIYTCVLCTHIQTYACRNIVHLDFSGPPGVSSRLLGSQSSTPSV